MTPAVLRWELAVRRPELEAEWATIRDKLRGVAQPDSRFDLDLDRFIPGFEGVVEATEQLLTLPEYRAAQTLFVTPDNSIQHLRWQALEAGKRLLAPSYGLHRGFVLLDPAWIGQGQSIFASWGDGMQWFGRPVAISALRCIGPIDAIVAGASAVTRNGVRFGMGHRYLDLEWNLLLAAGRIGSRTPVWSIVHDCQVLHRDEVADSDNVLATQVFTPTGVLETGVRVQPAVVGEGIFAELFGGSPLPPELRYAARLQA